MRKINAKFNTAFISEAGSILENKDYFAYVEMDDFACYVIADGIEDDLTLESAKIAVASIIRQFSEKPSMNKWRIKNWLKTANKELLALSKTMRLKASVVVLVTDYTSIVYGMAGNSRLQLFREGSLIHQTTDHSLSNTLLERGEISKDKVASHLERHNLYCYLGQPEGFKPEVSPLIKLVEGDIITMLTRGIWENIDDGELTDAINDTKAPQDALNNVEDLLLSSQPEKLDNYTLAAIYVDRVYKDPSQRKKLLKKIAIAVVPILLIVGGLLLFTHITQAQRQDQIGIMNGHVKQAHMLSEQSNFIKAVDEYKIALDMAQSLKLVNDEKNVENYYKTANLIVAADAALHQKEFAKAKEKYQEALNASYFADQLGLKYIEKQQQLSVEYMKVNELIVTGDQYVERKNFMGARQIYLEAKVAASGLYYEEARKEASDKIAKIDEQLKVDTKQAKEIEAAAYEQQAGIMLRRGNPMGAVNMLTMAAGMYDQAGKPDKAIAVQQKIAAIEDKMTVAQKAELLERLTDQGEGYEAKGDQIIADNGDYASALEQYNLALTLYKQSNNKEKMSLVQTKISNLDTRKQNNEKSALHHKGMEMEREGDTKVAQNQFDDARISYSYSIEDYSAAGSLSNVSLVQKKVDSLDQKYTEIELQKSKAAAYVTDGDLKTKEGNYTRAKYLYVLANDIYEKLGLTREKEQVKSKIKLVDKLSKGEA